MRIPINPKKTMNQAPDPSLWNTITPLPGKYGHASLIPLAREHKDALTEAVKDGSLWNLWYARVPSPEGMEVEIDRRLALYEKGEMHPYTVLNHEGKIVGMTCYQMLDAKNRRVKVGYTWYAASVQKTQLNTEAKLLLLTHAFEQLQAISVCFTTATYNLASRRAIERLGAKLDGILRNHSLYDDGTSRDTCYYSIIDGEWPAVRKNLTWKLEQHTTGGE